MSGKAGPEDQTPEPSKTTRQAAFSEETYTLAGRLEGTALREDLPVPADETYTLAGLLDLERETPPG
ncbi:hypothetical protein [Streptomyces sp. MP131-18]|uniref:hypothetical protein n=1 Tax=Streptomyces sp. MP131-18 TaxID=1857892 RepID=UPI00097C012D|nr:hypothetical protein [Streptomyces sp. MP131-18]ONK15540.1 hypothetical protein STBA_63720 [Streptomyces sp. MP131-18]